MNSAGGRADRGRRRALLAALSMTPMLGALAGAWVDERMHFGVSNWRSACRAAGFSWSSVIYFTVELLPAAIIGMLAGGLLAQSFAFATRRSCDAALCLGAHLSCVIAMPIGLILCALALPLPAMLVTEGALTLLVAWMLARISPRLRAALHT